VINATTSTPPPTRFDPAEHRTADREGIADPQLLAFNEAVVRYYAVLRVYIVRQLDRQRD
jgi:hypothetical protein